jgi:hypothetical protein
MNIFPLEWPIINHVKEKIGHGFKRLTNHKAVADEDLRDAQSIVWFQATTEPPFRNIE